MASEPAEEDFDDGISLTSTDDGNGQELLVERILAERHVNGVPHCLIKWVEYPLEQATWEPRENLTDELMANWEKIKADQRKELAPKFDIQEWKDALTARYKAKLARHNRRNIVRARRGYSKTHLITMQDYLQGLTIYSNEEEMEEGRNAHQGELGPAELGLPQNSLDNRQASHEYQPMIESEISTTLIQHSPSPRETIREGLFGTPDETSTVNPSEQPSSNAPIKLKSALKSADSTTRASVRFLLPSSETPEEVPKRQSVTHRTSRARSAGFTNIFAGGRTRKGRDTISEVARNPEVNPKFLNSRLKRKIELQQRNREGIKAPTRRPSGLISLDYNFQITTTEQQEANNSSDDLCDGKRRSPTKGVAHWEDEPMELDPSDSLFVSNQAHSPLLDASDEEMSQPDVTGYEYQPETQTTSKCVQLGPDKLNTVTLSFDGIPQHTGLTWTEQFRSNERLIFTHTCNSQDFLCQTGSKGGLSISRLCEGTVSSFTEKDSLKSLASNLTLRSLGLLCCEENFCVYIYLCDKPGGQPIQEGDEVALAYHIFKPLDSLAPLMLAPVPQLMVSDKSDMKSAFWSRPFDQIFGQKFEQLLPTRAMNGEKQNFFLAFPTRAKQEAFLLTHWLRENRSDCDVRTSYEGGPWHSFLKLAHGTVVIHEDMLWSIRRIPRLHDLLHGRRTHFTFWLFSRSLVPIRSLGSEGSPASPLGDIRLYRVFDPGAAFLVTPSFLVSEPEHVYTFLKWFWNNYVKSFDMSRPRKLVLCAKVDEWVNDLFEEQMKMRRKYPDGASEEELSAQGISDKALDCRRKSFKLFQQLVADASNENASSIVLAPEAIDGNDEQSLVNWFGEWSTRNIDQYRRYTVIGSGRHIESRLSRILQAPSYEDNVTNDPDRALTDVRTQPEPVTPPSVKEDESTFIKVRLYDILEDIRRDYTPVKIYLYPVGYSTPDVGFRLGDITSRYYTYEQWFRFYWRDFDPMGARKGPFNTYAGFFYTFSEDQASSRTFHNVQRSPWVALFRPVNPHVKPWKSLELFIWDINYSESIRRGRSFYLSDLLEGQQHLIDHIKSRTRDTIPLEKVWVGAFGVNSASVTALDAAIQWLGRVPTKVKDWIPAPATEIPNREWVPVSLEKPSKDREGDRIPIRDEDYHKEKLQQRDDASPRKRIFHPPQGHGQYRYTKCRNRLHQWSRQFDPKLEGWSFDYVFRPTMDWYLEQCDEGRGFEHIKVLPWKEVFQIYKIEEFFRSRS